MTYLFVMVIIGEMEILHPVKAFHDFRDCREYLATLNQRGACVPESQMKVFMDRIEEDTKD
jgi:hypothetical protein